MDEQSSITETVLNFVSQNGWALLFISLAIWYVWTFLVSPKYYSWLRRREDREWEARLHRDPDVVVRRQEEMEAARQRLQAQYDERARVHAERMKEKEEKNRATAVSEWEKHQGGQGYRSKVKASEEQEAAALRAANELNNVSGVGSSSSGPSSRPARRMRPEFNPLMGQGTSRFTPTPRGNVGGG